LCSVLNRLKKLFPLSGPNVYESTVPALKAKIKESAQLLLQRYVEVHGFAMTEIVRQKMVNKQANKIIKQIRNTNQNCNNLFVFRCFLCL
jgi:hypothetical protein